MCELLGLSSRLPTSVTLSMHALARHGSTAQHLGDGWGIAFHDGDDALLIRRPEPACDSPWVSFLESRRVRSRVVLAHVRHATQGEVSLRNTQPFSRELGGRLHVFAHNGKLPEIARLHSPGRRFRPLGSSDSELAFCALLHRMAPLWDGGVPSPADRFAVVAALAAELRELGPANFLYSDGELLFAHGHRRTQPDGRIAPPGLVMLTRFCVTDPDSMPMAGVALEDGQQVTLFASVPLSDEAWRPLQEGEIVVVRDGAPLPQPAG